MKRSTNEPTAFVEPTNANERHSSLEGLARFVTVVSLSLSLSPLRQRKRNNFLRRVDTELPTRRDVERVRLLTSSASSIARTFAFRSHPQSVGVRALSSGESTRSVGRSHSLTLGDLESSGRESLSLQEKSPLLLLFLPFVFASPPPSTLYEQCCARRRKREREGIQRPTDEPTAPAGLA